MESIGACWLEYSLSPWGSLSRICAYSGNMQSFCGTDGMTYSNLCSLNWTSQKKPFRIKVDGPGVL